MLAQRLITAAIGIPVIVGVILLGGIVYAIVAGAVLALASLEFCALAAGSDESRPLWRPRLPALAAATGIALIVAGSEAGFDEWSGAIAAAVALTLVVALLRADPPRDFGSWIAAAAAVAYVGFLGSHFVLLRDLVDGEEWVLLAVLGTWATDTFAYGFGRLFGRTKLAPRISPGKTVEGTAAAVIGGLASVFVLGQAFDLPMSTAEALLLCALFPPFAIVGDLAESFVKRGAGVKDTSDLVPGHGGFLDRLDSLLFTVPLVYYFALYIVD
ncbi:MAG TPA: phosphatidate cytidylyltransferase [Dehalococcoidia bacterium]